MSGLIEKIVPVAIIIVAAIRVIEIRQAFSNS